MKRYTFLLIGVLLALLMALVGGAAAAEDSAGVILSGTLSIIHGDPLEMSGSPVERYFVTDAAGTRTEILIDGNATSARSLVGRQVVVSGVVDEANSGLRVTAIAAAPGARAAAAPAELSVRPWVSIACKFADVAAEPRDTAYLQGMYGDTYPLLAHFWQTATYGQMTVSGQAAGWFNLPRPRADYFLPNGTANLELLFADCTAAADPFVYFPYGARVNMMFNESLGCCAWGGSYSNDPWLDGNPIFGVTWLPPWAFNNLSVVAHEMGHAHGLNHTSHSNPELGVYSNPWDVMSDTWANCGLNTDPVYGCIPQGVATLHKGDYLDWIPESQIYVPHEGAQTIVLENATNPQTDGYLAVALPSGYQTDYWLEARSREGYDTRLPGEGVIIHEEEFDSYLTGIAGYLVDQDPWGNGLTDSAVWTPGEVFTGWWSYVRVLERTASGGYRLEIVKSAEQETIDLSPSADTYVNSAQPAATYGANLAVHTLNGAATRRAYFKFDTAALPDAIVEARLRLMPTQVEAGAKFGRIFAAPCDYSGTSTPWTESGLNWNNAPLPAATHWLDEITIPAQAGERYSFDVTPALLGAAETCFVVEATTDYLIKFSSKEGPTPPVLTVTYLVPPNPPATTTTFAPTNDAYVMQARPQNVYGARTVLQVKDAAKDVNSFIKFNVSGLTGTVRSATLRLWVNNPGPDGGRVYSVSPFYLNTTTQWLETGLKWSNAPAIGGAPLDTVGNTAPQGQWVELDVTSAVVAALGNNGRVSLALTNDSKNLVTYSSKEGPHPPELVVISSDE